ncbi:GAF domain-containing protein [Planomonospora sp. ID67723]|uniref:ATP-binding protein n=1 Tax=Planomonospora sp. ID67723 TaxID=2738134 RepID=UPI0018C3A8E8|nr:ATP-binding protein [Planomonospora sp. ID67723]MBG0830035.1 GAF domain-containing protein [Planomonospora sp. ID67723]
MTTMPATDRIHDARRLRLLHATGLLEESEVPLLDRVTRLAARWLRAPVAMVSLIEADRQVVVSSAGPADPWRVEHSPLSQSLCQNIVVDDAPLTVADARADVRWRAVETVSGGKLTAYAGMPLRAGGGQVLGALCVIDDRPRQWNSENLQTLEDLAAMVESEIAVRLARTQAVLDRVPEAALSFDASGAVTAWNVAAEHLFGWSTAEATGCQAGALISPRQLRTGWEQVVRRIRQESTSSPIGQRLEVTAVDRSGREFPAEMIVQVDAEQDGSLCHAVLHDITAQRRMQMLREAHHAVVRVLADAHSSQEAAAGVVTAIADALGWTCGEYWQVDPGQNGITRTASWCRPGRDVSAFTSCEPLTFTRRQGLAGLVWDSGHPMWVDDLATDPRNFTRKPQAMQTGLHAAIGLPIHSGEQVHGVLTFFTDTAQEADEDLVALLDSICAHVDRYMERRRAEELALELAESRRRFEQIIAQLDDDVWTIEIGPDGAPRALEVSPNLAKLLGGPIPAGTDPSELVMRQVHPDDRPAVSAFQATTASGGKAETEYRLIGLDGVTRWIWMRGMPRREGDLLVVDGISTDITDRRQLAEQRERLLAAEQQQVRRLRELDVMKDELMALVTHELRNPIGAIRGYAELLLDDETLTGEQRSFADVIDRKSAHLQRLVDDLLDLARLEAGGLGIDPRPVALTGLLRETIDDHRAAAAAKRLTIVTDLAQALRVHADPVRIRQLADNLLSNAIKYTPVGGTVTVTAAPATGRDGCVGEEVVVTVADTGIGIPAEQYGQLFSRFFRASTAKAAGVKGTGLGLAITKAIAEAHGGTITAAPREGGGTVFTVCLPIDPSSGR